MSLNALADYALGATTMEPLYNGLAPSVRTSTAGQKYAAKIATAKLTGLGAMTPNFTQNDTDGKPVKLSDFRGKCVLVDF